MTNSLAVVRTPEPVAHATLNADDELDRPIGESAAFQRVLRNVETVASTGATVLIVGETGSGKELVARALHRQNRRAKGALVTINCAALPPNLLESELFGHEKGAFSGAVARRTGRFELAHDGTIFLDEIGEMSTELQPKLLRILQERQFERVGGSATIRCNARVVAATHRELGAMVREGTFREDLFYRLNVFPIVVPPLRDRREDIPILAASFARQFAAHANTNPIGFSEAALKELGGHDWPGNIRELKNVIERTVIMTRDDRIQTIHWGDALPRNRPPAACVDALETIEREHILSVLLKVNWVVGGPHGAAARLGLNRTTLNFRMQKLGIRRPLAPSDPSHR